MAPESDDNPWHYKISWNPRNIVMAGKDGAKFLENGKSMRLEYDRLFDPGRTVYIPSAGTYAWYPNRDSEAYISRYGLEGIGTFIRTTLRHPDFCFGWKNIIDLKLTAEDQFYDTDGMAFSTFFQVHLDRNGFSDWLQKAVAASFSKTREYLDDLIRWLEAEKKGEPFTQRPFMAVDAAGDLGTTDVEAMKREDVGLVDRQLHEASLLLKQLFFLGLDSTETIDRGRCAAVDVLQWAMEKKLALSPGDKDMILMLHEVGYELGGKALRSESYLVVKGEGDSVFSSPMEANAFGSMFAAMQAAKDMPQMQQQVGAAAYTKIPTKFRVGHRQSYKFKLKLGRMIGLSSVVNEESVFGDASLGIEELPEAFKKAIAVGKESMAHFKDVMDPAKPNMPPG